MDALENRHLNTIDAEDESFDDYVANTTDPGNSLFLIALLICIVSIVALPQCVLCLKRIRKNHDSGADDQIGDLEIDLRTISNEVNETQTSAMPVEQLRIDDDERLTISSLMSCFVGDKSLGAGFLRRSLQSLVTIAKFDSEAKRILRLVIPFTFSAAVYNASRLFTLAIISHSLGTDDMVAYAMVGSIVGVFSSFTGGWIEAISSLGSMAYGARNYRLTGHYLQISFVAYIFCEIPMAFVWIQYMGNILILMGFAESVAIMGQNYVWVAVLINIMTKLNMGVMEFLEVIEKATYASAMYCISSFLGVILVVPFAYKMDATLEDLGLALLLNQALFFALNVVIPAKMGWLKEFEDGLFKGLSFKSLSVVNEIFQVALPLAFGSLLASAEWETLTILAAMLGPAEAATWSVLGYVWDFFESTTEAIGDASELRVAYHLGNGNPDMAQFSGYKSMLLAAVVTGSGSVILMSLTNVLPALLTYDETIQGMLVELFPLVALGNVTMSMGMVCWAIVGAQGRYRLSTTIATSCAFFITIPIAAVSTVMRVDLRGLTFAVVVGYTATAMLLSLCVLMSDWKALAEEISEEMEMDDSSSYSSGLMKRCPGTLSINTPAKPDPYTPPINTSSRSEVSASYLETSDYRLLPTRPSLPTLTPVSKNNIHREVVFKDMNDSSLYNKGLMKVSEPPLLITHAASATHKPPLNRPLRTGDFASHIEMTTYQLRPKHTPVGMNDVLREVLESAPMPPVLAALEARVKILQMYKTNCTDTVEKVELSPFRGDTNPKMIEAAPSAASDKSSAVVLSMSLVLSTESPSEKAALLKNLEEDDQSYIPDTSQLSAVTDPIPFGAPAMLVNKKTFHQPVAKSTFDEIELDLPKDILEPPPLIAMCPSATVKNDHGISTFTAFKRPNVMVGLVFTRRSAQHPDVAVISRIMPESIFRSHHFLSPGGGGGGGTTLEGTEVIAVNGTPVKNPRHAAEVVARAVEEVRLTVKSGVVAGGSRSSHLDPLHGTKTSLHGGDVSGGVGNDKTVGDVAKNVRNNSAGKESDPGEKMARTLALELLAVKLAILPMPSPESTDSAVPPTAPEANEPPMPTASDLVHADTSIDTTTIPMSEFASEPAPDNIVQPPPLIARVPFDESLSVALITPSTSSTEPIENAVLPPTPEADAPKFSAVEDPGLTDKSPDTPDIPAVVDNTATLQESAAKPTHSDIVNDSEDDVNPASIDSDNDRIGDVNTSSSLSAYEEPVCKDELQDAPSNPSLLLNKAALPKIAAESRPDDSDMEHRNERNSDMDCHLTSTISNNGFTLGMQHVTALVVDAVTHSELAFEPRIDEFAMDHSGEHGANVDFNATSSESNNDIVGDVGKSSLSSLVYEDPYDIGDGINSSSSSVYKDPVVTEELSDIPVYTVTLFEPADEPTPDDVRVERSDKHTSNIDVNPASSISKTDFIGDVISSSSSSVHSKPEIVDRSPVAPRTTESIGETATLPEPVVKPGADGIAIEPRDVHDAIVDVNPTSSDSDDDFIGDVIKTSPSLSASSSASLSTMLSNLD